jgi:hypothetical protein
MRAEINTMNVFLYYSSREPAKHIELFARFSEKALAQKKWAARNRPIHYAKPITMRNDRPSNKAMLAFLDPSRTCQFLQFQTKQLKSRILKV